MASIIPNLIQNLQQWKAQKQSYRIVVGFDGFVDRIQKVVQKKVGQKNLYYSQIDHFARHIATLASRSGQIELSLQETKIGGNAPIMAQSIACLGLECCCIGTMGWPQIVPVFKGLHQNIEIKTLAPPAQTDAYEFDDGKLIFSECSTFTKLNWEYLKTVVGLQIIKEKIEQSNLFAAVDWVNLPWCNSLWKGILEEIVVPGGKTDRIYFFDIADPSRKSTSEIKEVLKIISDYHAYGCVVLGLNETEAREVHAALSGNREFAFSQPLEEIGAFIFSHITVSTLMIHPVDHTLLFNKDGKYLVSGRVVTKPKILTGGGDNLNAGFCLGQLLNLPPEQAILLGMATSGAYVQNGQSPSPDDLISYLQQWEDGLKNNDSHLMKDGLYPRANCL